jgi:ribonuclease BN (tRNA processing enzyme)
LKVTVLGSGTLVPAADRGSPGLVVEVAGEKLLFDSGSGTLYRAAGAGIDWRSFSNVFYTHLHPDHTLDLVSLLFAGNYAPGQEDWDLAVYGPKGLGDFIDSLCVAWPAITPKNYRMRLKELSHAVAVSGEAGWEVTTAKASHDQAECLAYRVTDSAKSIVFTGDTEYCESLVQLSREADLLICECSTDDSRVIPGHLTPAGVARLARESGVPRVLITHVYPPADPGELARCCAGQCDSSVTAARDLEVYEV